MTEESIRFPLQIVISHHHVVVRNWTQDLWAMSPALKLWTCKESLDIFFFFFLVFRDRVSLYSPGCPGTHSVDQAGLKLRNPPASASRKQKQTNKQKILLFSLWQTLNIQTIKGYMQCYIWIYFQLEYYGWYNSWVLQCPIFYDMIWYEMPLKYGKKPHVLSSLSFKKYLFYLYELL
jgi:hypothetical protein